MDIKATLPDGTVLEGPSEEVANAIRALKGKAPTGSDKANGQGADEQHSAAVWTMKRAQALWNWLYGDQQKLVRFLLDKGGMASLKDIKKELGMKKGNQVAGVRSCITRNARRETGYKEAVVIDWASGDHGEWYYKLVPEVHELLKQIADKQRPAKAEEN